MYYLNLGIFMVKVFHLKSDYGYPSFKNFSLNWHVGCWQMETKSSCSEQPCADNSASEAVCRLVYTKTTCQGSENNQFFPFSPPVFVANRMGIAILSGPWLAMNYAYRTVLASAWVFQIVLKDTSPPILP